MLLSSVMAYRSLVEVLAGVKHLPRYAAFLTSSSPKFRHSSVELGRQVVVDDPEPPSENLAPAAVKDLLRHIVVAVSRQEHSGAAGDVECFDPGRAFRLQAARKGA
jgi:hypothetical protein